MKTIDLITPHIMGNEKKYLLDALESNWVAPLGPYVERFEKAIAEFVGAKHAVAVSSGTAAIHLALLAAGVKAGDKVAVADLTFIASVNPVAYIGAEPVFIDSEWDSFNMDPEALRRAASVYDLKAVIVPHFYGMPADMFRIKQVCTEYGIILIEDATEALGSSIYSLMAGTIGDIGCFSFNGNKIITSSGGGMVVTNNQAYAEKVFYLATQAKEPVPFYQHNEIGFNYRLSNLCAAVGLAQFEMIATRINIKQRIYDRYCERINDGASMLPDLQGRLTNRWMSCAVLEKPFAAQVVADMAERNIETRRVWFPLHKQKPYIGCPFVVNECGEYSASEYMFRHGVCLPSDTKMTDSQQDYVIDTFNAAVKEALSRE